MTQTPQAPSYRLLIAEDDREIGELLRRYFTARGVETEVAPDGDAAWISFVAQPPDVLLTDLMMPRLSGTDLVMRVRSHPTRARTPIVIMSANIHSNQDEQELMAALKVERAFRKPLPLAELLSWTDRLAANFWGKARGASNTRMPAVTSDTRNHPASPSSTRLAAVPAPLARVVGTLVPERPKFDPFVEEARTAATEPVAIQFSTPAFPSLASLVQKLVLTFEAHHNGVMVIPGLDVVRRVTFVDGVIVDVRSNSPHEEDGAALVTAGLISSEQERAILSVGWESNVADVAVQKFSLRPSLVVQALEQHTRLLMRRALTGPAMACSMLPIAEPLALHGRFRLDPLEALMDACLRLPDEGIALAAFQPHLDLHIHRAAGFNERVVVFARLCPGSTSPASVMDSPTLREALQRVTQTGSQGARELLALVMSQTLRVAPLEYYPAAETRAAALTNAAGEWRTSGLEADTLAIREAVAREWIRTNGMHPAVTLNVAPSAGQEDVERAVRTHTQRFGPPALDSADLGPAKTYLAIVRARRAAAAGLLRAQTPRTAVEPP